MPSFPYVTKGQRIEIPTAEWHNAIVAVVNQSISVRKGVVDKDTSALNDSKYPGDVVQAQAVEDIPFYSIFTIDDEAAGKVNKVFDIEMPMSYTKQISSSANWEVLVVNHFMSLGQGSNYVLPILGTHKPYLVNYDDTDGTPTLGGIVGPKAGTYKVSTSYGGCVAVSPPDTTRKRVWVVRQAAASSWYIGKTTEIISSATSGTVEQHAQGWVATGITFTAYNPHDVDLPSALKVRWTTYPMWDGWIVEPWHFTEC